MAASAAPVAPTTYMTLETASGLQAWAKVVEELRQDVCFHTARCRSCPQRRVPGKPPTGAGGCLTVRLAAGNALGLVADDGQHQVVTWRGRNGREDAVVNFRGEP